MRLQSCLISLLLPASLAQAEPSPTAGLVLSNRPVQLEKWEESIAEFEHRDEETPPPQNPILFVGSSSIRLWDLKDDFPDLVTVNNGFGGSTLADSIHFFERHIAPYQPSAVVLYAGDNDIAKGLSPIEVLADFVTLSVLIERALPDTPVVFIAIKPSVKRWDMWPAMASANQLIGDHCRQAPNLYFADIAAEMLADVEASPPDLKWFVEDGLHLSDWGYDQWAETIGAALDAASSSD
ncbi:MAG: GDSL-type esterase/lipase family protein [Verrucomicrobiota bacterium]